MWNGRCKGLNENLAPLRRFLRSNVGRPWDKVFAEICEHLNFDSAVQLHIWQHIRWEVCMHRSARVAAGSTSAAIRCGNDFLSIRRAASCARTRTGENGGGRRRRRRPTSSPANRASAHRRLDGIWYEFLLAPVPSEKDGLVDLVLKRKLKEIQRHELIQLHGGEVYAVKKRQRKLEGNPPTP
jgi:hypothetical protein